MITSSLASRVGRRALAAAVRLGGGTFLALAAAAQAFLEIQEVPGERRVAVRWTNKPPGLVLESTRSLSPPVSWTAVVQAPTIDGDTRTFTAPFTEETRFYRLRLPTANRLADVSPRPGETGVAVTRETIVRFTRPLAATASLSTEGFHAEADGRRMLARVELAADRTAATLFPLEHLPASARIRVVLQGGGLTGTDGLDLDADGDGAPGGTAAWSFSTAGITPLAGTAVSGRVFASEPNPDGSNRPLEGVTISVDGAEETLRTTTNAQGFFLLHPCPPGRFFVHVDGRTAVGSAWPGGAYYPFIGKAWEAAPGQTNVLAGGTGEIFLPLVPAGALREVSPTTPTPITFNPEVVAANPALAGVQIVVPPNALLADSGLRGGMVGLAPVPPDRLPEPLPPGLAMPLVITIQTDGPENFAEPVPVRFPNLPDPVTGLKLPPGAKSGLWSFNHDTGRWELQGPMTVSADGSFVDSDPGVGVRQPGWHGVNPGSDTDDPAPDPPPDDDGEEDDPEAPDPWNKCKNEIQNTINAALDCAYGAILPDKLAPGPDNQADTCAIGAGLGQFGAVRDCLADPSGCKATLINNTGGALIGCSELIGKALGQRMKYIGPMGKVAGFIHGCVLGPGLNFCAMADCLEQSSEDSFCVPDEWEDGMYRWLSDWDFLGNAFRTGPGLAGVAPADTHTLGEAPPEFLAEARTNPFLTQIRFTLALRQWLTVFYGTDQWFPDSPAEATLGAGFLRQLDLATDADGEGGVVVTAAERAELMTLPRPLGVTDLDVEAIISRMERMFHGTLSDAEWNLRALLGSGVKFGEMAAVYEAMGWTDQLEAFKNGLLRISQRFETRCRTVGGITGSAGGGGGGGTGGGGGGGAQGRGNTQTPRSLSYLLLNLDSGFTIRGKTQAGASLGSLIFAPNTYYALFFVDNLTGTTAVSFFKSAGPGQTTTLPCAMWLNGGLPFPDTDGDGLTDLAERAVGASATLADSDGDGRSDRVELADDTNPLDGLALPNGLVGVGELPGGAALTVAAENDRLHVGGSPGSALTVFDLSQPRQPVRLGTLALPGLTFHQALAVRSGRVAVGGPDGLALLDARDPSAPTLLAAVPVGNVVALDWLDAEVVALAGSHLHLVNAATGIPRLSLRLPETGDDVQVVGDHVHVLTSARLIVFRPADFLLVETDRIDVAGGKSPLETGRKLFVGGGRAYVGTFTGFSVVDVRDPSRLTLLGTPPSTQAAIHDLAANDAGLLLPVVSFAGSGTLAVGAYDIRDPADVTRFLTSWPTPGNARSLTLHRGLAYVADSFDGVQVLNYLPADTTGVAPAVTFTANFSLAPARAAFDAPLRVLVEARDDVQVREVTAFVDDVPAGSDGSFPFQLDFDAPGADSGRTNFTLRLRATDTAGNTRWTDPLVVALTPGVNAPRALAGFPSPTSRVDQLGLTNVWVEFDQPLAPDLIDADALVVTGAGADLAFDTADDVAMGGHVRPVGGARLLEWTGAAGLPIGHFRVTVAAGLRGTNGVARTEPLSWTFETVNVRPRLTGSTPSGTTPTPVGGLQDLVVQLDLTLTPPRAATAVWGLREAGPDRTRGNGDDTSVPLATVTPEASGREFRLTPQTPLGAGRYRVTLGGTGFTASQVDFELRPVPSEWVNPAGGLWSSAANWSGGAPLANDFLRLPRLTPSLATTNRSLVVVSRIESAADFVQEPGKLLVTGEGLFDGLSRFLGPGNASIEVDGGGTLVNRGTMAWVGGGPAANRALVLRNITVANRGLLEWQAGQLSFSDPAARLFNEAAGIFDLGPLASRTLNGISASGRQGRIVNAGLLRKTTGTNIVLLRTVAFENSGRVVVGAGGLDFGEASGPGEIEIQAGAAVTFHGRLALPPDARITGAGDVSIVGGAIDSPQELRHRHELTGLTAAVSGYTEVRRSLDHAGLQFVSQNGWFRFFAPILVDRLWTSKGSFDGLEFQAPATTRVLQLDAGILAGPAGIDVTEHLFWSAGKIEAGDEILVRGDGELRGGGQLSERQLRIASGAVVVALVTNTTGISPAARGREGRLVNEGTFVKRGPGRLGVRVELENRGVIRFEEGEVLFERQPSGQGRLIPSGGELQFAGGDLALHLQSINGASLGLVDGVLRGFGRILNPQSSFGSKVQNAASVRLDAPGKALVIVDMGYEQTAAGELVVTLGEAGCGQLVGDPAWSLVLKGRLRVELEPGFSPALGQSYTVIPQSRSGTFDEVALPDLGGGRKLEVTYPAGQVVLTVVLGP